MRWADRGADPRMRAEGDFDRYARSYEAIHARNLEPGGEPPAYYAAYKQREIERILVVDDNPDAADTLAEALRMEGHEVRVALDGPGALAIAPGFRPHSALLDIGLPVMDGYELAGRLRNHAALAGIRLIAVSGYGQPTDRRRSLDAGFAEHLVKPVELEAILDALGGSGS